MIVLKPGKKVRGFEIVSELNRGAFAVAYEARTSLGERIFLKQYKSPSRMVDWYTEFVDHQKEIKHRIESDPAAKDRCYRFIDFFEEKDFFQAFEFVDGGKTLTECIADPGAFKWRDLVTFAKVMMFGIQALHKLRIVHTDLKPDNIILIPDASIGLGYKLRVIDLDWAIFDDGKAPWDGKQGYVGTPMYLSPEHQLGKTPTPASDIFTCGIMLGEALGGRHPFGESGERYGDNIIAGRFEPIRVGEPIPKVEDLAFLESVVNSCLHPEPFRRPTAGQLCDALLGKRFEWHGAPKPSLMPARDIAPPSPPLRAAPTPAAKPTASAVELSHLGTWATTISTTAECGKTTFKKVHSDAQFLSDPQFRIFRDNASNQWMIEHIPTATNETVVDGNKLTSATPLRTGMRIAVGNTAKGIEKFPLIAKLSDGTV